MPEAQYKYMELDQGDCVVPLKIRGGHYCAISLTNYQPILLRLQM